MTTGKRIKEILEKKEISEESFREDIGMSKELYYLILEDKIYPSNVSEIAKKLGVSTLKIDYKYSEMDIKPIKSDKYGDNTLILAEISKYENKEDERKKRYIYCHYDKGGFYFYNYDENLNPVDKCYLDASSVKKWMICEEKINENSKDKNSKA